MQLFISSLLALFTFACCSVPPDVQHHLDATVSRSLPLKAPECTGPVCPANLKNKPRTPKAPINIIYHGRIPLAQGMQLMCVFDGVNRKLHCISFYELKMREQQKKDKRNKI